jgi:outer membrane lipase/esterase
MKAGSVALAAAVSITALAAATTASAQQFNRAVIFGDSLSDNGNIADAAGGLNPNYLPAGIRTRRFTNTNGVEWSEHLFGSATRFATGSNPNAGNVNYAFGGSLTSGPVNPGPSTQAQIATFFARGGRFATNDVAAVWAGANNLFGTINGLVPGLTVGTVSSAQAQAAVATTGAVAAGDIGTQVRQLTAAGAQTVVVMNLPDFARAPQFANTPISALAGFSSTQFNTQLAGQLAAAQAANPQANIITVDINSFFGAVLENPGAFGFTNVTQQCVQVASCRTDPNATGFLFFDGVHPTGAAHQLVGAVIGEYLVAPSRAAAVGSALSDTAFALRRSAAVDALATLGRVNVQPGRTEFFVNLTGAMGQSDGRFQNGILATSGTSTGRAYEYTSGGIRAGVAHNLGGGWTVGGALYAQTGQLDGKRVRMDANATQLGIDLLARYAPGSGLFVNMGLGLNADSVTELERRTVGPLVNRATATGTSFSALAEVGYDVPFAGYVVTPVGRLGYIRTEFGGFNEAGAVAPISYFSRTVQAMTAAAELRFAAMIAPGVKMTALVGYEGYVGAQADAVTGRLVANSARPFAVNVRDPISPGLVTGVGLEAAFGAWTAQASYRGTLGDRNTLSHNLTVGAKMAF